MKQPRELDPTPNTRMKRASYGKQPNDLNATARTHFANANKMQDELYDSMKDSGWSFEKQWGFQNKNPVFQHKESGYLYNPKTQKVYAAGDSANKQQPPEKPNFSEDFMERFGKMNEQRRLGGLALASSMYGRDLYHDADLRSGKRSIEELGLGDEDVRPEHQYQDFSDNDLREASYDSFKHNRFDDLERYDRELARRGRERQDAMKNK